MAEFAERLRVTRAVMKALGHHDFRSQLAYFGGGREVPIVVALPGERMADLFARLTQSEDHVVLATIMPFGDHAHLELVSIQRAAEGNEALEAGEDECPLHQDTTVAMLLTYLQALRKPVRCHLLSPDVTLEILTDNDLEAPA